MKELNRGLLYLIEYEYIICVKVEGFVPINNHKVMENYPRIPNMCFFLMEMGTDFNYHRIKFFDSRNFGCGEKMEKIIKINFLYKL